MATLKLKVSLAEPSLARIIDHSLQIVRQLWVPGKEQLDVELPPGLYQVEVKTVNGTTRKSFALEYSDQSTEVLLEEVAPTPGQKKGVRQLESEEETVEIGVLRPMFLMPTAAVRLALWSRARDEGWVLNTTPKREDIFARPDSLKFLRVVDESRQPILLALPTTPQSIYVATTPSRFEVSVKDADKRAELMYTLLEKGDTRGAAFLAKERLRTKVAEPPGAAQGAIALLSLSSELEPMNRPPLSWFANLKLNYPWIPDGPIAWAWYGLHAGMVGGAEAKEAFLEAARRGIPSNTRGLFLLLDGLEMFCNPQDESEQQVLREVKTWVAAADPDSRATLLRGPIEDLFNQGPSTPLDGVSPAALGATETKDGWVISANRPGQ